MAALHAAPPQDARRSDDDLNPEARIIPPGMVPKPAAVLVPLVARSGGLSILSSRSFIRSPRRMLICFSMERYIGVVNDLFRCSDFSIFRRSFISLSMSSIFFRTWTTFMIPLPVLYVSVRDGRSVGLRPRL